MARIAGVDLPREKRLDVALTYIYGIGPTRSTQIVKGAMVRAEMRVRDLSEDEIVSTVIVLLNAGHEASVNTLGNGMLAFARHPAQWERVVHGDVAAAAAVYRCAIDSGEGTRFSFSG